MKKRKFIWITIVCTILLCTIASLNLNLNFIFIPLAKDMVDIQISYITINTVFIGFAFTSLGLLLGLSSEKLIKKIQNTDIIINKVKRLLCSIFFLVLSVVGSLYFVLGFNITLVSNLEYQTIIENYIYIFVVGYMIIGIVFFVYSVYELYDLIKRVYRYNKIDVDSRIKTAKKTNGTN